MASKNGVSAKTGLWSDPELVRKWHRDHYKKNKDRFKKWHLDNRDRILKMKKEHNHNKRDWYRNKYLKRVYGITLQQYKEMSASQNNVCAICLNPERYKNKQLAVDHDHATGKIRGLLCSYCNYALWMVEAPERMERAIKYLSDFK